MNLAVPELIQPLADWSRKPQYFSGTGGIGHSRITKQGDDMKRSRMISFAMGKLQTRLTGKFKALVFLGLLLSGVTMLAQGAPPFDPKILLPSDPDTVVITYSEVPDMLANPDPTPLIRVFGDGEVLVHYPKYMKLAGDYQLFLNPGELRKLLLTVSGVIGFDAKLAAQARREEKRARFDDTGIVTERSDEVLERIEIQLDGFQDSAASSMRVVNERVEWRDIGPDAREFPGLPGMKGLGGARNALRALLDHPDLYSLPEIPAQNQQTGGGS